MKKLALLFLMISNLTFAQEAIQKLETPSKKKYTEVITINDVVKTSENVNLIDKNIVLKNGKKEDKELPIKVKFGSYEPSESDIAKININLDHTIWLAKFKLKNPVTYVPTSVDVKKGESSWTIMLWYYAKNDLGIEKEGFKLYKYDLTGKEIK